MLNHLIATIMICLGVANTTPISNCSEQNHVLTATKKNANIVNNYSITPQQVATNGTIYNNQPTGHEFYPNGRWNELYYRYQANNSYINTIVEQYNSRLYADVEGEYQAMWQVEGMNETANATRLAYFYKLTPYNYNQNTQIQLVNWINITENTDWDISGMELNRTVYKATDPDWNQFFGRQIVKNQVWTTKEEIENINNGFYYIKEEETIRTWGTSTVSTSINDIMTIEITPDVDNYIYIIYTPKIIPVLQQSDSNIPANGYIDRPNNTPTTITGTNIIPDETYEVVDIPGMMFEIIGMPFAFVSQAFNLTLFPGTPYQINIANLFLSIIAIFVFVWLLLLFIKMKAGG